MIKSRKLIALLSLLMLAAMAGCRTPAAAPPSDKVSTIVLAPPDEPGQRLMLTGTVIDSQTGEPIPGAKIYLYHADADGEYSPSNPADESTARLSGEVSSSAAGEFLVDTIVPREYDQPGNRHIHLHYVRAEGYLDGGGVILFENDVNADIRQWATDTGFGTIIKLEEIDSVQHGNIIIELVPLE